MAENGSSRAPQRWIRACRVEALRGGRIVGIHVDGRDIIVVQRDELLFAAERACPHEGADLSLGRCHEGRLHCPRHFAWFDLASGAVSPGWSFRKLEIYPARIVGDEIFVALDDIGKGNVPS